MALTLLKAVECMAKGIAMAQELGFAVAVAVGVSGAVPAENDHTIADVAAGHPVIPKGH
jgi:uncharacterized protein GlcG (DUF336 family)